MISTQVSVLITEDNNEVAAVIIAVLRCDGYRVHHAKDGEYVRALFARWWTERVTLAVNMPHMHGIATLHKLTNNSRPCYHANRQ